VIRVSQDVAPQDGHGTASSVHFPDPGFRTIIRVSHLIWWPLPTRYPSKRYPATPLLLWGESPRNQTL